MNSLRVPQKTSSKSVSIKITKTKAHPPFVYFVCLCAGISGFTFGFSVLICAKTIRSLSKDIDTGNLGFFISLSGLIGAVSFIIPTAFITDTIGRQKGLLMSSSTIVIGSLIAVASINVSMLLVGLFTSYLGAVAGIVVAPVYIAECSPKEIRGFLGAMVQMLLTGGLSSCHIFAILFSWKVLFYFSIAVNVVHFIFILKLPESPRHLINIGNHKKAALVLESLRQEGNYNAIELQDIETLVVINPGKRGFNAFKCMFTIYHVRKALMICCACFMFQQLSGIYFLTGVFGKLQRGYGYSEYASKWLQAIPQVVNSSGTLTGALLVDRIGRKRLISYSFYACSISLAVMVTGFFLGSMSSPKTSATFDEGSDGECALMLNCFQCINNKKADCIYCAPKKDNLLKGSCVESRRDEDEDKILAIAGRCSLNSSTLNFMQIMSTTCPNNSFTLCFIGFFLFMLSFSAGAGPVPSVVASETLPLWARPFGVAISRFSCFVILFSLIIVDKLQLLSSDNFVVFLVFSSTNVLGGLFTSKYVHETLATPLEWVKCVFMLEDDRKEFVGIMVERRNTRPKGEDIAVQDPVIVEDTREDVGGTPTPSQRSENLEAGSLVDERSVITLKGVKSQRTDATIISHW